MAALLWLCLISVFSPVALADPNDERVSRVKAAFILNIVKFVAWPTESLRMPADTFTLCYYREDPLGSGVEMILNKRVLGLPMKSRLIENLSESDRCRVLLIAAEQLPQYMAEISNATERRPVLTITDLTDEEGKGVAYSGVIMNLVRRGSSIGFEIDTRELKARRLSMSSELLKLAHIIDVPGSGK
ncbi:putative transmembrane protein [Marinobacterium lacunae]|uniref:Putative transmembrane protein n=1 Tax=Marinobacterium lacunae TaxID=1232683 RepID=A0A081FYE9_9GAMM|nr:YfiR family protein [Marinobacterium lacunae]KEA63554.1 putative transmembrane protein [Marinobacterium lacunae]